MEPVDLQRMKCGEVRAARGGQHADGWARRGRQHLPTCLRQSRQERVRAQRDRPRSVSKLPRSSALMWRLKARLSTAAAPLYAPCDPRPRLRQPVPFPPRLEGDVGGG